MNSPAPPIHQANSSRRSAAKAAGLLLIVTAGATAVSVASRVAADADRADLMQTLLAISANQGLYSLAAAARVASGICLLLAAWFWWRSGSFDQGRPPGWTVMLVIFAASSLFTSASGASALALAALLPGPGSVGVLTEPLSFMDALAQMRGLTGKMGFALAGLGLLAVSWNWRTATGTGRVLVALTAVIGLAMQFIWWDAATSAHRASGVSFLVWLIAAGALLLSGRLKGASTRAGDSD